MYRFSSAQLQKALIWLSLFHIIIIAASNYLVQFPFEIYGFHTTWGAFTFPFIFLATDLTVRIFGQHLARKIIFRVMLPTLVLSYSLSVLFQNGTWTGWASLVSFNGLTSIETRPALPEKWAYVFFVDLEGHVEQDNVKAAIEEIRPLVKEIRVLGSYPMAVL